MNQVMDMVLLQQQQQQSGYGGGVAECRRAGPRPGAATAPTTAAKQEREPDQGAAAEEDQQQLLRRGPWTVDEDLTLVNYIAEHGEGRWNALARAAGLKRTGKSCRLRWLNYLRPDVKRGDFTADEQLLILDLHSRWGNRWSKIASQLPGRTDNEIKNYWRTRVQKHAKQLNCDVNSRRFKDAMRFLWMPRLAERAAASSAAGPAGHHHHRSSDDDSSSTLVAPTTTVMTTATAPDNYHSHDDEYHRSPGAAASCSSTTTSSLTSQPAAAASDDDWAAAADQEFWSTASALQQLTADHLSSCGAGGGFQDQVDQDLISGWVQGFTEAGTIISSDDDNCLWSLDDIWRTMH